MSRVVVAGLLALLTGGCHSYLVPFDETSLPPRGPIDTRGGGRLDLDAQGQLVERPGAGDVSAVLGVGLAAVDGGLLVTHRLRPRTLLRPDDVVVHVAAAAPPTGSQVLHAHHAALRAQAQEDFVDLLKVEPPGDAPGRVPPREAPAGEAPFDAFDPSCPTPALDPPDEPPPGSPVDSTQRGPSPAAVRARAGSHPVRSADDLRGYLVGTGWAVLDLVVVRAGVEVVVRHALEEEARRIPILKQDTVLSRWNGVELLQVRTLPEDRRPLAAQEGDSLVLRVSRDSPLGRAGLRPLDLVSERDAGDLLASRPREAPVPVRDGQGRERRLTIEPREEPVELWVPFLLSYQSDGVRWHLGLGPLELLYHASGHVRYSPTTDSYERTRRWSVGTSVQGAGVEGAGGERNTGGVNLFYVFGARTDYLFEWLDAERERRARREALWD